MRSATEFIEKALIRRVYPTQLTLNRLARQTIPNEDGSSFSTQSSEQTSYDNSHTANLPYIFGVATRGNTYALATYHQADYQDVSHSIGVETYIYRCAQIARITLLSPTQWEADTLSSDNAVYVCQRDILIIRHFR